MSKLNLKSGHFFANPKIFAAFSLVFLFVAAAALQYAFVAAAKIENALATQPAAIDFGIVFPQESFNETFSVALSSSFSEQDRVNRVNYEIIQKPKCKRFNEVGECAETYPNLCPILSETPEAGEEDLGIEAPHETQPFPVATGGLDKSANDPSDNWSVGLKIPCFEGECPQGYDQAEFGTPLSQTLKGQTFGCDLWVQVTGISESGDGNEVSPENPSEPGPGDTNSTSTAPQARTRPISRSIARLLQSFPVNTARAFEAHIISVSATIGAGSPAQFASEPSVRPALPFMKSAAGLQYDFYTDPLNDGALSVAAGGSLALCAFGEVAGKAFGCTVFSLLKFGLKKFYGIPAFERTMNDPPREDFNVAEKIKPAKPIEPLDDSAFGSALARYFTSHARRTQLYDAITTTFERTQGAIIADSGEYMLLQNKVLADLMGRLAENQEHHQEIIKQLLKHAEKAFADGLDREISGWTESGFSSEQRQTLLDSGWTLAEIEELENEFLKIEQGERPYVLLRAGFLREAENAASSAQNSREILRIIEGVVSSLENLLCVGEEQPATCVVEI